MANVANAAPVLLPAANINLDTIEFNFASMNIQLDSNSLCFLNATDGVIGGYPVYSVMVLHNNSSISFKCNEEVFKKASALTRNQRVSIVIRCDIRNNRIRLIDIG